MKLFVYGTLKRGHSRHEFFKHYGASFIRNDVTTNNYLLVNLGDFAGLIKLPEGCVGYKVAGEIYECSSKLIEILNSIEQGYSLLPISLHSTTKPEDTVFSYQLKVINNPSVPTDQVVSWE